MFSLSLSLIVARRISWAESAGVCRCLKFCVFSISQFATVGVISHLILLGGERKGLRTPWLFIRSGALSSIITFACSRRKSMADFCAPRPHFWLIDAVCCFSSQCAGIFLPPQQARLVFCPACESIWAPGGAWMGAFNSLRLVHLLAPES